MGNEKPLEGKRILFFSQYFFGYENTITDKMRQLGAEVSLYDEMSVKKAFDRALLKVCPGVFHRKTEQYYKDIINREANGNYDFIIFIDCEMPTEHVLQECRRAFPDARLCLHLWDSLDNLKGVKNKFRYFDYISSFDRRDAKECDLVFRPLFYSDEYKTADSNEQTREYRYDLSFIGTIHSDRYSIIRKIQAFTNTMYIYPYLQSKFIYYFYFMTKSEFRGTKITDFKFEKINSKDIANVVRESRAVLDIQHPKQRGLTMRTLEMLGMKKKFVTTNEDIQNYDFYNPNNICIIDRNNPIIPGTFYVTDYEEIPKDIYQYYSLDQWVLDVLGA